MDVFYVDFHHGGLLDDTGRYVGGIVSNWKCDGNRECYFEILSVVKEMRYSGVLEMWYDFAGTLKELIINDFGAIELLNWSKTHGKVDVYIVHHISQLDVVDAVDVKPLLTYVQPTVVDEIPKTDIPNVVDDIPAANIADVMDEIPEADIAEGQHDIPKNDIGIGQHDTMSEISDIESQPKIRVDSDHDEQSDDSALGCIFDDSDDEVLNDGINEVLVGVGGFVDGENDQVVDEASKGNKGKGGRPKKKRPREVPIGKMEDLANKGLKKPCLLKMNKLVMKIQLILVLLKMIRGKMVDRGLSDSDYKSEELEIDEDSSGDYLDEGTKENFSSFVMPNKFLDYKWVLGIMFSPKEEFKEAITNYDVHNGRDLPFIKNDKIGVKMGCKEGCEWVALCSKLPNEDTWQHEKID
ncbi:unnamed protein product [Lathyrus sativus]|nr:unnamed protein product [Lathyrus sativus]